MSMPTITYAEVIDIVRQYIKNNCKNLSDTISGVIPWENLNAEYKSGYVSSEVVFAGSSSGGIGSKYKYTLTSNGVISATLNNFETNMTAYLTSLGITNTTTAIPTSEFLNFVNDMVSFCSARLKFVQSNLVSGKVLVYDAGSVTYEQTKTIGTGTNKKLVAADDALMIIKSAINVMKSTLRCMTCQYTLTLAST